jgi:hypothetical protein
VVKGWFRFDRAAVLSSASIMTDDAQGRLSSSWPDCRWLVQAIHVLDLLCAEGVDVRHKADMTKSSAARI